MKTVTSNKLVESLRNMFASHGIPYTVTSDNASQFTSKEFHDFVNELGISHRRTTSYWPQAGEVERQNRSLLKRIKIAQAERKDWRKEPMMYLLMYRSSNYSTTGVSPAELMFKRKLRTKLPAIQQYSLDKEVEDRDAEMKGKRKLYADKKRRACGHEIEPGVKVLVKMDAENKSKLQTRTLYSANEIWE